MTHTEGRIGNHDITSMLSASDYLSMRADDKDGRTDCVTLRELLKAKLPTQEQPSPYQVRDVIDAIAHPRRLNAIIESILADPDQLNLITSTSFGHNTGMERIELASDGQYRLRLHFWMPGNDGPITEDPHNHVYNFGSKVLSGTLVTDLFARGEEGNDIGMFQIATQTTQTKPEPEYLGEARLRPLSTPGGIILSRRDPSYTMSHRVIHRVRQVDQRSPIITLNLRAGNVRDLSIFYRDDTMTVADPTPTQVDVESRLNLLREFINPYTSA